MVCCPYCTTEVEGVQCEHGLSTQSLTLSGGGLGSEDFDALASVHCPLTPIHIDTL